VAHVIGNEGLVVTRALVRKLRSTIPPKGSGKISLCIKQGKVDLDRNDMNTLVVMWRVFAKKGCPVTVNQALRNFANEHPDDSSWAAEVRAESELSEPVDVPPKLPSTE
jgi:hypothetical protein